VDVAAGTFALYDPITDAAIDGSTLAWSAPEDGVFSDTVKKVFEIATPYTGTEWQDVRVTNNGTEVTFWHPSHKPKSLRSARSPAFRSRSRIRSLSTARISISTTRARR
jgi:hypothetical protein